MKNIVFDLGGVVVDWNPERLMQEYPGDPEMPLMLFKKGFFTSHWQDFDRGTADQRETVRRMSDFSGRHYDECWDFMEFVKHSLRDIPETQQLIKELSARGFRLFCLSNMSLDFYDYLKDREVFQFFEGQIISALEKTIKPEKNIFEILMERYGVNSGESVFIDDLEQNIRTAAELGFHTVHFADKEKGMRQLRNLLDC